MFQLPRPLPSIEPVRFIGERALHSCRLISIRSRAAPPSQQVEYDFEPRAEKVLLSLN